MFFLELLGLKSDLFGFIAVNIFVYICARTTSEQNYMKHQQA
jgi:hypothetical protein